MYICTQNIKYMRRMRSGNIYKEKIIMLLPTLNSIPLSPIPAPNTHTPSSSRQNAYYARSVKNHHRHSPRTYSPIHTHTCGCSHTLHTHTHIWMWNSSWHVQINQKAWRKRCVFSLTLEGGRSLSWILIWILISIMKVFPRQESHESSSKWADTIEMITSYYLY